MGKARRNKKKMSEKSEEIKSGKLVVLMQDECHLLWGDTCGYVWGKRNEKTEIPMINFRERQTYYGALNLMDKNFHLEPYKTGNGENTVAFIKSIKLHYGGAKLLIIWDGASYHKSCEMQKYLAEINKDLEEKDWKITCILFAPNAPEQNLTEDVWLQGKDFLRKNFAKNNTFSQVKQCFFNFLNNRSFVFEKLNWYNSENLHFN